ncbi:MAG: elongation factor 4 [Candidatus Staskawiczbacteria bacterium RIFCSPLOWO2_01_FULL_40_39]|uniref:Elongation factor 4 n=1 Tax=Candidatus Staskawiczbacteria bacterium RIFCSPHIGHO2_01_FULL_39_25 TaxID=1802202 RepID=A0A1G2HQY0_9BACT|nr:MAG: elongation factor 4 [Candidatus Staskawiczbacteria bacterium RIFCSPHIGHO2_01_FULL_39_25]OGZ74056.1 MAG: elongation factor 4 [Candidatus Staskawiczbacteria bacterium RIFCSPLOWO2_01_FULL_40_39]
MSQEHIRNFCIIAHIDHGKSTLADRLLELTNTVAAKKMTAQFLDSMDLEKEKGITIKLKPVRMNYAHEGKEYILNLVDTPGHVDFSYEVSRSLAAVEGAVLLVDATQGIQAQTLANIDLAKKQNLVIIPVINKIDMPAAKIEESCQELANVLDILPEEVLKISAKNGLNVEQVLQAVIEKVPSPEQRNPQAEQKPFRALIFDSTYDAFKGVLAFVRVMEGNIRDREKIELLAAKAQAEIKELGYLNPRIQPQPEIFTGEIGYIATGIKEPGKVRVGDTIVKIPAPNFQLPAPLAGYQEPNPMVFASFYPENPEDFELLKVALSKLKLQDPALVYEAEMKEALGRGFRCGFLGTLHVEIISERLEREFNLRLVISTPSVIYKIFDKRGRDSLIYSASDWPDPSTIEKMEEPWVLLEIIAPASYIGKLMEVLKDVRGNYLETNYLSAERAIIKYEAPLRAIVANLYDKVKSTSQGYASLNYTMLGYRPAVLVKMEIWIAGRAEEAFSRVVEENDAYEQGKKLVEKLKEALPPQQFTVALQAVIGGKVIARETISARRKDVTGYLYGGDKSRKKKLLEKQKKGKALLKEKGRVNVPSKTFLEIFRA